MSIVDPQSYQARHTHGRPLKLIFLWKTLPDPLGATGGHNIVIDAPHGDMQTVIDDVKAKGGVYQPDKDGEGGWFLPWPPAGIRVEPA